jgi:glucose-6-phosphate 1-dehydrogenase
MVMKEPGADFSLVTAEDEVALASLPHADPLPPYVRLIHDVIINDRSLFTRPDGLGYAWDAITGILNDRPKPLPYAAGSWGPAEGETLAAPDGWLLG